jgi:hypothetical protein
MAEEAVIFPDQPLFMVDRGWQRSKKKQGTHRTGRQIYEQQLDLQPSRVPEVTITVAKGVKTARPKSTAAAARDFRQAQTKVIAQDFRPAHFMSYEPPRPKKGNQTIRQKASSQCKEGESATNSTSASPEDIKRILSRFKQTLPGTATPLYSVLDPEVTSFQEFISYCESLPSR